MSFTNFTVAETPDARVVSSLNFAVVPKSKSTADACNGVTSAIMINPPKLVAFIQGQRLFSHLEGGVDLCATVRGQAVMEIGGGAQLKQLRALRRCDVDRAFANQLCEHTMVYGRIRRGPCKSDLCTLAKHLGVEQVTNMP